MTDDRNKPFVVIAFTYLLYFGQLGILTPYLGVFLDGRGFSSNEIGSLLAIITLTRIIGPALWANLADKRGQPLKVMQLGCLLAAISFAAVFLAQGFYQLTLVLGLMMMFWTAVLPQLEVITLGHLRHSSVSYGTIRLWGSIGFILLTIVAGKGIDLFGSESPIYLSAGVLTGLFLSSLLIRPTRAQLAENAVRSTWKVALQKPFVIFILSSFLLQMSFGAFYGFFALYMRDVGYDGIETGLLIALGVLAEVGIFLVASRIITALGVRATLLLCLFLTAIRWWITGFYGAVLAVVIFAQLIHALSFGLTHATSVHFIHGFFPASFQSRGQAIYISLSFGIGGAIGHYIAGYLWQDGEGASLAFAVAGIMSLLAGCVLLLASQQSMQVSTALSGDLED